LRYRTIRGTDLTVSEVGFGVWTVTAGWWGQYTEEQAIGLLRAARDRGINFFDTADTYGNGYGESIMAKAFSAAERADLVVATKFGYDWEASPSERREGHQEAPHNFEPAFVRRALENSLRRLDADHIDLWQLHNVRMDHLLGDDLWGLLEDLRAEGKIRSVGVALGPAIGWLDEGLYSMRERNAEIVHMIYNALELDPGRALIAEANRTGRSLLVRVPHSSGMLEGKYTIDTVFPENDHRRHRPRAWLVNGVKKIEQLDFLTEGRTLGQAALRFVLRDNAVASALPNIYDLDQIEEFAGASEVADITDDEAARIEALYDDNYGMPLELEQGVAAR